MPSSRGSSQSRDWICISCVSCIDRWVLYHYCQLGSSCSRVNCTLKCQIRDAILCLYPSSIPKEMLRMKRKLKARAVWLKLKPKVGKMFQSWMQRKAQVIWSWMLVLTLGNMAFDESRPPVPRQNWKPQSADLCLSREETPAQGNRSNKEAKSDGNHVRETWPRPNPPIDMGCQKLLHRWSKINTHSRIKKSPWTREWHVVWIANVTIPLRHNGGPET